MSEWFLNTLAVVAALYFLGRLVGYRESWLGGRSDEYILLEPHLEKLHVLGRKLTASDADKDRYADHFEYLSGLWLSGAMRHDTSREAIERALRRSSYNSMKNGFDLAALFQQRGCKQAGLFLHTKPLYKT